MERTTELIIITSAVIVCSPSLVVWYSIALCAGWEGADVLSVLERDIMGGGSVGSVEQFE